MFSTALVQSFLDDAAAVGNVDACRALERRFRAIQHAGEPRRRQTLVTTRSDWVVFHLAEACAYRASAIDARLAGSVDRALLEETDSESALTVAQVYVDDDAWDEPWL